MTNASAVIRIFKLIEAVMRDPFQGIGKPELLPLLIPNQEKHPGQQIIVVEINEYAFLVPTNVVNGKELMFGFRQKS
jgi:hypothetical protein